MIGKDTVVREESDDGLLAQEWRFWFDERRGALVLSEYVELSRTTRRHKFKPTAEYCRIGGRSRFRAHKALSEADVPLTEIIKAKALDAFTRGVRVVRWSEVSS